MERVGDDPGISAYLILHTKHKLCTDGDQIANNDFRYGMSFPNVYLHCLQLNTNNRFEGSRYYILAFHFVEANFEVTRDRRVGMPYVNEFYMALP